MKYQKSVTNREAVAVRNGLDLALRDAHAIRYVRRLTILCTAICFSLYAFVLGPLYEKMSTDVLYADAIITYVVYNVRLLLEMAVFFVAHPATVYSVWVGGLKASRGIIIAYSLLTFGKFLANFLVSSMTYGALPTLEEFFTFDLPIIAVMFLLELLQYAVLVFIACRFKSRYQRRAAEAALEGEDSIPAPAFPFTRLFSFKNPVQGTILVTSIIMIVTRALSFLINAFTEFAYNGWLDVWYILLLNMLIYILPLVFGYFVMILLLGAFDKKVYQEP